MGVCLAPDARRPGRRLGLGQHPGAAGAVRGRPALRFDVELAVPTAMAAGVLLVQANAYNAKGGLIAATRLRLAAEM